MTIRTSKAVITNTFAFITVPVFTAFAVPLGEGGVAVGTSPTFIADTVRVVTMAVVGAVAWAHRSFTICALPASETTLCWVSGIAVASFVVADTMITAWVVATEHITIATQKTSPRGMALAVARRVIT